MEWISKCFSNLLKIVFVLSRNPSSVSLKSCQTVWFTARVSNLAALNIHKFTPSFTRSPPSLSLRPGNT